MERKKNNVGIVFCGLVGIVVRLCKYGVWSSIFFKRSFELILCVVFLVLVFRIKMFIERGFEIV